MFAVSRFPRISGWEKRKNVVTWLNWPRNLHWVWQSLTCSAHLLSPPHSVRFEFVSISLDIDKGNGKAFWGWHLTCCPERGVQKSVPEDNTVDSWGQKTIVAGQCRTNAWPSELTLISEFRCRANSKNADPDYLFSRHIRHLSLLLDQRCPHLSSPFQEWQRWGLSECRCRWLMFWFG